MQCEYRSAREGDVPALRELWKEAFGDGDRFLDQFFEGPFAPERSRVAVVEGAVSGALYWFPASCKGQSLAYLYGVATAARLRGRDCAAA
ncbi:MAG: GNAT family N-acetyltransferase [Oscillospiraceae bacterium]